MSERLIKPYEISVWEDKLTQNGFIENKLAVIGSDTMTGLNKVYDPVFNKKSNGEKTLSFSLKYKYFDPYSGNSGVINPFANLLVNERKVKLHYDNQWYEFIVKDHTESSDGLEWTYTCTDAFVLELSKNGYNITFDAELNNNQGTAQELAEKILKDTDWQLGGASVGRQLVSEPIYKATLLSTTGIEIVNTDNTTEVVSSGTAIYLFYSYVKNKNGKYIQFIIQDNNRQYTIDDNNVITDTNFRIIDELEYKDDGFYKDNNQIISFGEIETKYQANRLVYGQRTTYDPIKQRTVSIFKANDREIYKYTDYSYTTSNIVMNYITNGDNFNVLEDGTLQGWNPYVDFTKQSEDDKIDKLELVTYPELGTNKELADITALSQVEGFLKACFKGALTSDYKNAIYNSGIENNASFVDSISLGQEFIFRWRAGVRDSNEIDDNKSDLECLIPYQNLRLLVAKYTRDDATRYGYYYRHIDPDNIILQFEGTPIELNNYIRGGSLVETTEYDETTDSQIGTEKYNYVIDNVVQTPSTKYIYVDINDNEYVWDGITGNFIEKTSDNYRPYYYLKAAATKAVTNNELKDTTQKIGIFIYTTDNTSPIYIQDIQLTRFIAEGETGNPILIGNTPVATTNSIDYYYLKPSEDTVAEDIQTYTTISDLAETLEIQAEDIIPVYNEDSEKILTISASQSNCFNILQTIAETFECWIDLVVVHDARGFIEHDEDGRPRKYVYLRQYAGKDNWAGFKYGINLQSIERTVNSDEIVTKLIVDLSQSDYVDEGFVSIANAPSNQSGESYIINFDYYYNQGLLDRDIAETDRLRFIEAVADKNNQLQLKEKERRDLEAALVSLSSDRNVFTELIDTAQDTQSQALEDFYSLTGQTYEDYKAEHTTLEEDDQLTEEDTIYDILGQLYISSATINNYAGVLTNKEQEYWRIRHQLRGSESYKVTFRKEEDINGQQHIIVELNDYLPGFQFTLGETYEETFTISKKYFDIESNETTISFSTIEGYNLEPNENSYLITSAPQIVKIVNVENFDGVEDEIKQLQEEKEELVNNFNNTYRRFIQEGTWNSTDYIDSELYYLDALQISNTSAQPTVSYTINVVEISELEGFEWYLFDAGDKTYVEDTEFFGWANINGHLTPAREEVIVSEVEWHLDRPEENVITVQNYKTRFEDLFQRISAAVQTVQFNEATYAKISSLLDTNGSINQDVLLESLNRISGQNYNLTSDGSVLINGDQILVQNLTNPANRVIINSEGIRISSDGGQTWRTAINGQGINIGTVYTGTLNTDNVIIGSSDNPSFRWDKAGISAYKSNSETGVYDLKTYVRYDEYGLYGIKDNTTFKAQSLEDVLDKAHFAVTWNGFFIRNSYTNGRVEITSDNDFRVIQTLVDNNDQYYDYEKIKIGALEFDAITGQPTKYGININRTTYNQLTGQWEITPVFTTGDDGNITITGTIYANSGEIGGMIVNHDYLSMQTIMLEPGVGIYSTLFTNNEPIFSISDVNGSATFNNVTARGHIDALTGTLGNLNVIDTIVVGDSNTAGTIQSTNYINNISGWSINSNGYAEFANANVRGHIEAQTGDFTGWIAVGDRTQNSLTNPWIVISGGVTDAARAAHGSKAVIKTSNYQDGTGYGWMINSDGNAYFNNITARGAIKTAVFEYAEIQAVGGIFLFRPSSVIKGARVGNPELGENKDNLILKVEKPLLFEKISYNKISAPNGNPHSQGWYERTNYGYALTNDISVVFGKDYFIKNEINNGSWCKISNYITNNEPVDSTIQNILLTNGLSHVYQVINVNATTKEITLANAASMVVGENAVTTLAELEGGALIDMGREDGTTNYGIGVNSSDNTVNLPARAISLFETEIQPNAENNIRVTYNYRGILGTLPILRYGYNQQVHTLYHNYMEHTQGIYTDNIYIGDSDQYLAFYTDKNGNKHLRISAQDMIMGYDPDTSREITWGEYIEEAAQGKDGKDGTDAITVRIESNVGNEFIMSNEQARLTCTVYQGNVDITNTVTKFTWTKLTKDGVSDNTWNQAHENYNNSYIDISANEVNVKAIFNCHVTIPDN